MPLKNKLLNNLLLVTRRIRKRAFYKSEGFEQVHTMQTLKNRRCTFQKQSPKRILVLEKVFLKNFAKFTKKKTPVLESFL